jgi:hydrocephalus-inducing protein
VLLEMSGREGSADLHSRPDSEVSSAISGGPVAPPGPGAPESAAVDPATKGGLIIDMHSFVLSEYLCDFGNVIKNAQSTRTFKITNVGFTQISFEFSKNVKSLLSNSGFIVEPDRVNRLPGAPDFETVEFNVVFNSSRPGVKVGPLELLLPLQIKGGPQVRAEMFSAE